MKTVIYKNTDRGVKDIGWLRSNLTFSFSDYFHPDRKGFGLLRVFNDDFVQPKNGFGLHGHGNMEIISIMLGGRMNHADTLGYKEVVEKDWVQIMSAGSGLRHEEHNVGEDEVNFLQIWIEPKLQNIAPRYQKRYFPEQARINKIVTVVSNEEGQSHCWINQNAKLSLGYFTSPQLVKYSLNPLNKCIFVFLIEGNIQVGNQSLQERDGIGVWETDLMDINISVPSRFLIIEVPINN